MNARVHVLHLSSSDALPLIAAAKREGVRVTVESCPHFLTLTAEEVPDGATEFKCCPPIREAANQDALWEGLAAGTIDCIVSDHSPCTADLKTPDFASAWGGISSLQLGLPAIWTEARKRGHSLDDVVRWMSAAPAELAGLPRKGAIEALPRRRLRGPRHRCDLHRRPRRALPPQPGHRLRRQDPARRREVDVAARTADRGGRHRRRTHRPPPRKESVTTTATARFTGDGGHAAGRAVRHPSAGQSAPRRRHFPAAAVRVTDRGGCRATGRAPPGTRRLAPVPRLPGVPCLSVFMAYGTLSS